MPQTPAPAPAAQPVTFEEFERHIESVCTQAGLPVMVQVLTILWDRESVSVETLMDITADDVEAQYNAWIAPGIDRVESALNGDFN